MSNTFTIDQKIQIQLRNKRTIAAVVKRYAQVHEVPLLDAVEQFYTPDEVRQLVDLPRREFNLDY